MTAPARTLDVWPGLAPGERTQQTGRAEVSGGVTRLSDITRPSFFCIRPPDAGRTPP